MRLPHRLQGQKVKSQGGAWAYCGGDLSAQLVQFNVILINICICLSDESCICILALDCVAGTWLLNMHVGESSVYNASNEGVGGDCRVTIAIRCCRLSLPDNLIVTPFAQILHSLRTVRNNYVLFTNQPPDQQQSKSVIHSDDSIQTVASGRRCTRRYGLNCITASRIPINSYLVIIPDQQYSYSRDLWLELVLVLIRLVVEGCINPSNRNVN